MRVQAGRARPWLWLVAAFGCLALVAGCGGSSSPAVANPAPSPVRGTPIAPGSSAAVSTPSPANAGRAQPGSGSYVLDLTWISDQTGWALSSSRCGSKSCLGVARTTDGGRSWRQLPTAPGAVPGDCQVDCVSHIRFATASIGYLFGPALFLTRDGGAHWVRQRGLAVESLEPADGAVFRVAYTHTGCPGPCGRLVQRAAPGSVMWHTVLDVGTPQADSQETDAQITRSGRVVYVPIFGNLAAGAGTQHTIIFRSLDNGVHWRRLNDPCGGSGQNVHDAISLAAAPGGLLTALCIPRGRGAAPVYVLTSTDHGSRWSPARPLPDLLTSPGMIAAADPAHLVVASTPVTANGPHAYLLLSSDDGGRHWRRAVTDTERFDPRVPATGYLGFQDATVGRWVAYPDALWTTHDAGTHWTRQPYP